MPAQAELTTLALAEAARRAQLAIRRQAVADVTRTWQVLDLEQLSKTWPVWLDAMMAILTGYQQRSATDGALFYRAVRQFEVAEPGNATVTSAPSEDWMRKALGYSAPGVYQQRLRAGTPRPVANRTALTRTLGVSTRVVLDGTRSTIAESVKADKRAIGFARVTDGDPCAFCALVASRGPVYKTAETAGNGNAYHNDCGCIAVPSFKTDFTLSEPAQRANDIYSDVAHLPNRERLSAFRKAWANRAV